MTNQHFLTSTQSLGYDGLALAQSNAWIGIRIITGDDSTPKYNSVFFIVRNLFLSTFKQCSFMADCMGVSKDTPFPVTVMPILYNFATLRLASSVGDELNTST